MTGKTRTRMADRTCKGMALVLICLAALRGVVPTGFMPDVSGLADGVFQIVICSPHGVETRTVDATGAPVTPGHTEHGPADNGLCLFAGAAALALVAAAVVLYASVRWPVRLPQAISRPDLRCDPSPGPLGPRAPPLI